MPGMSADACAVPTPTACRHDSLAMCSSESPRWSPGRGGRWRRRSKPSSSKPFRIRKPAADSGEANTLRSGASSTSPRTPAGIVPTTSSQPSRASVSSARTSRSRSDRPRPRKIRFQSCQKNTNSTIAVARWVATRNDRKYLSFWWMFHPTRCGKTTAWPRLEIGNGSATPCIRPSMTAWKYEIGSWCMKRESLRGFGAHVSARARGEPREREAAEPHDERCDAVLEVVRRRPRLVAGEERRQRLGGLDPVDDCHRDQQDADDHCERDQGTSVRHRREGRG